ncbi:protein-glutamate methylesterase/protein-glutamine glutaminase [Anaeromicropila herbilytica]|uniref:Protein-glutamate methylesterase/protein-glutamine glutaminase n=1 Tax=Anaeromicropila herbilytica TaxID=2785025 RepID=A0A7R7ID55_9FIRM|nr:chemotaxis response regulator protein-glutamate methylesterase [Anaeromicropila herbilytica]BCN30561.1 chemotaxis response regulator protein-glutamate methylesterase [Anaeromicropila herbilytica]
MGDDKIKVLIVDDSLVFREILTRAISIEQSLQVVATARDPYEAIDKIAEFRPDVMICDIEMPKMDGIEFIQKLLPEYSIPVIVVSAMSERVLDAMHVGAFDFILKPNVDTIQEVEYFFYELISKIKSSRNSKVNMQEIELEKQTFKYRNYESNQIIAIGASTGGTEALLNILKNIPSYLPGIVVVQHIPAVFSEMFANRLNAQTNLTVKEAKTGDYVKKGHVYIAPGDKHMRIKKVGEEYRIECFVSERVNGHCPSVNVLFHSVAKEAKNNAVGIILTGMGNDGAEGMLSMYHEGARTIGQDEATCVVYGMPKVAYQLGAVEAMVPLHRIPLLLNQMLK